MYTPKFCSNCGNTIVVGDKFCGNCGVILNNIPINEPVGQNFITPVENKPAEVNHSGVHYLAMPLWKFAVLSIATFGLYEFYWFYKNWRGVKMQEGRKISPFWRTFFAPLFAYSLFKTILFSAEKQGYKETYSPLFLALVYIALINAWRLPDPGWIIFLLGFIPLLPTQEAINFIAFRKS